MLSLIHRSLEGFITDSYGSQIWHDIVSASRTSARDFPAGLAAAKASARGIIFQATRRLGKPPEELLEDLGSWLVLREPVRRLLRFSGPDIVEFIHSIDEFPGRALMVIPDIPIPAMSAADLGDGSFRIDCDETRPVWLWILAGALRGMADDYGALAIITVENGSIHMSVVRLDHADSRPFELAPENAA